MQSRSLHGRVALVSGGNRGLGLAVVQGLAERGAMTLLGARDLAAGEHAAAGLRAHGLNVQPVALDVADSASVAAAAAGVEERHGRLDVLVNNAGILAWDHSVDVDAELADRLWRTNALGAWTLALAALPLMRRHGWGRIVNVTTEMASLQEMDGSAAAYRVSKAALNAVTRVLAADVAGSGILVNACSPGWVRTSMGGPTAPRSIEQGARSILWGVDLPDGGPTGTYTQDGEPLPW